MKHYTAACGKNVAGQLRRGMKCHGYEASTPSTGFLSLIHQAEAP